MKAYYTVLASVGDDSREYHSYYLGKAIECFAKAILVVGSEGTVTFINELTKESTTWNKTFSGNDHIIAATKELLC